MAKVQSDNSIPNVDIRQLDLNEFTRNQQQELINAQIRENNVQKKRWNNIMIVAIIFLCIGIALIPAACTTNLPKVAYIVLLTIGILSLFIGATILGLTIGFLVYYSKYNKVLSAPVLSDEDETALKLSSKVAENWKDEQKNKVLNKLSDEEIDEIFNKYKTKRNNEKK